MEKSSNSPKIEQILLDLESEIDKKIALRRFILSLSSSHSSAVEDMDSYILMYSHGVDILEREIKEKVSDLKGIYYQNRHLKTEEKRGKLRHYTLLCSIYDYFLKSPEYLNTDEH